MKAWIRRWLGVQEPVSQDVFAAMLATAVERVVRPLEKRIEAIESPLTALNQQVASQPHDPEPESRTDSWDPHFGNG